ncbi:MAG: hypothetical protein JXD21_05315 [Candidatus Omnitrophica bacterium]|nr:hypothetical protein [Candidatus Omnitrophota bacterium]
MAHPKTFCVIGTEFAQRQRTLTKITHSLLNGRDSALHVNVLYAHEVEVESLRELISRYSFGGEKIIIFKEAHMFSEKVKKYLLDEWDALAAANSLVFDIEQDPALLVKNKKYKDDRFLQHILKSSQLYKTYSYQNEIPLYKLLWPLRKNNQAEALYILEKLFLEEPNESKLGMQVLGMLIREFSRPEYRSRRQDYLTLVWEADRLIKERGLTPKLALSLLLTKIFSS